MKRPWLCLAVLGAVAPAARADGLVVRAPCVQVEIGPVVSVQTPYFRFATQLRPLAPPVDPGAPPPVPVTPVPYRPVPAIVPVARALTPGEFASSFRASPGPAAYEVILTHPCTGCPVKVCFQLPGCPKRVRVTKTTLEFRYGLLKKAVIVTFCRDGSVRVKG